MASEAARLTMCQIAIESDAFFAVSPIETGRAARSYTIDTADRLLVGGGMTRVDWLIGADNVAGLPTWHRWQELIERVHFVVMGRPGIAIDWERLPAELRKLRDNVVPTPLVDISATEIRARVAAGRSIRYLTPTAVANYIEANKLYRGPDTNFV